MGGGGIQIRTSHPSAGTKTIGQADGWGSTNGATIVVSWGQQFTSYSHNLANTGRLCCGQEVVTSYQYSPNYNLSTPIGMNLAG